MTVRGVLHVHSAPPALGPHIEWAVGGVLGVPVTLPWVDQPASPGMLRTELAWQGPPGTGGAITSALATWNLLRFEVTEEASPGCDAVRYSYTPTLGLFGPSPVEQYAPWGKCTAVAQTTQPREEMFAPGFDHLTTGTLMDSLTVEMAEAAARRLWSRAGSEAA